MSTQQTDWQPVGRGRGYIQQSKGQKAFRFTRDGFTSEVFTSLAVARTLGWSHYKQWLKDHNKNPPAPQRAAGQKRAAPDSDPASVEAQCALSKQPRRGSKKRQAAAAAPSTAASTPLKKKKKPAAGGPKRKKGKAAAAAAAARLSPPPTVPAPAASAEGGGSNFTAAGPHAGAAAAAAAATVASSPFPITMTLWHPGSQADSGKRLQLNILGNLGKGGFGEVHKVCVKASGQNSLKTLNLTGSLAASLKQLLAGSGGSSNSGVMMAMKVAMPFCSTGLDMQRHFNHDPRIYAENVKSRMVQEFTIMQRCASSPHIINAFACGSIIHSNGSSQPAILMEFAELGDAEQAFLQPAAAAAAARSGLWGRPAGISSRDTQRIVRAAALGLRDLHRLAGWLHCDMKTTNLLAFGSPDQPTIKLCDFGVAKPRTSQPMFGPVSGTKDWQAPEQASAEAGRLDYSLDSWGLGLLVLALRRGKKPFWWLAEGLTPADVAASLAAGLGQADNPYLQPSGWQPGAELGPVEVAFVKRCMVAHGGARLTPEQLLKDEAYLNARYRGG